MVQLLGRKLTVSIGARSADTEISYNEDFQITFTIKRSIDGKTPDTLNCSLFNVDFDNIWEYLFLDDAYIRIQGGYEGVFGTIFEGDITNATQHIDGVNLVTEITAGDGEVAIEETNINKSYSPDINVSDVIDDLINTIVKNGEIVKDGFVNGQISSIPGKLQFGDLLNGKASNYLSDYLNEAGKQFVIADSTLRVFENSFEEQVISLTTDTGLIDSPREKRVEKTSKAKGKQIVNGVDFRCLIIPGLLPGQKISIQDNEYIIQDITLNGTSRDGSWEAAGFAL